MKVAVIFTLLLFQTSTWSATLPNDILFRSAEQIFVVRENGSDQTAITPPLDHPIHPRWSRDGSQIVFSKGTVYPNFDLSIWRMRADGSNRTFILDGSTNGYLPYEPVFSPNADRIAYVGCDCIFSGDVLEVANVDGTGIRWVAWLLSGLNTYGIDWSPTGERLVYSESSLDTNAWFERISVINSDGTGYQPLTLFAQGLNKDPAWSPDGSKIAFASDRDGNWEIYTMSSDGSNQTRVTNSPGKDIQPTWSPDGTKLAFASDRNGSLNIYKASAGGSNVVQITHNAFDSSEPHWNPSAGSRLRSTSFDFDGDGRSDVSVFRPSDGTWYLDRSTEGFAAVPFGLSSDQLTPADYDGDGETDVAIFRDGTWWVLRSSDLSVVAYQFGQSGDVPVPADYTGDGRDEVAIYRAGEWWSMDLTNFNWNLVRWGAPADRPVVADYDGDGKADQAVYRDGTWYLMQSTRGQAAGAFGLPTDTPIPADYDGDGKSDIAVFRDGTWYLLQSTAGFTAFQWGLRSDTPVPADYDGNGKANPTVFRDGVWYQLNSNSGVSVHHFGTVGDTAIPASLAH